MKNLVCDSHRNQWRIYNFSRAEEAMTTGVGRHEPII